MPIKEFHLDRVLRDLDMTHEQVDYYQHLIYLIFDQLVRP